MNQSQLACVFPGQGSQQVGMLGALAQQLPLISHTFARASEVLGYDLWQLVQAGPQEQLNLTEFAQPALLTASTAIWLSWCEQTHIRPKFVAGHSLGEWSALVASGVLAFEDAVNLVRLRGQFMQAAVPVGVGGMAVILDLADQGVIEACQKACSAGEVAAVNFNAPGQVVIAGELAALELAMQLCKEAGAKRALRLPVSAPFHTQLMLPAAERLKVFIQTTRFESPKIPVLHNFNAAFEADPEIIKELMVKQIYSPVLWVDSVRKLASLGVDVVMEIGAGKVLGGLNKRIAAELQVLSTGDEVAWATANEFFK